MKNPKPISFSDLLASQMENAPTRFEKSATIAFPFVGSNRDGVQIVSDPGGTSEYFEMEEQGADEDVASVPAITFEDIHSEVNSLIALIPTKSVQDLSRLRRAIASLVHPDVHRHLDRAALTDLMSLANAQIDEALSQTAK